MERDPGHDPEQDREPGTDSGDPVDRVLAEWAAAYPDIDLAAVEVIVRITRIGALAQRDFERVLVGSGVTRGEFDVLGALARSERRLRPSEVTTVTMVSNAATTKYVESLVRKGFVERGVSSLDGRVVLLGITASGRAVVDRAFPVRVARDTRMLDGLGEGGRRALVDLLRRLSADAERVGRG